MAFVLNWIMEPLPHSYVEVLSPNVTIFGVRAYKKASKVKWGHKDVPWSNRISVLVRRDTGKLFLPLCLVRKQKEASY